MWRQVSWWFFHRLQYGVEFLNFSYKEIVIEYSSTCASLWCWTYSSLRSCTWSPKIQIRGIFKTLWGIVVHYLPSHRLPMTFGFLLLHLDMSLPNMVCVFWAKPPQKVPLAHQKISWLRCRRVSSQNWLIFRSFLHYWCWRIVRSSQVIQIY